MDEIGSGLRERLVGFAGFGFSCVLLFQPGNLVDGANIAGFLKVAQAMLAQGVM